MNKRAFTLIELMIIVAIIGILASIVLTATGGCTSSQGARASYRG